MTDAIASSTSRAIDACCARRSTSGMSIIASVRIGEPRELVDDARRVPGHDGLRRDVLRDDRPRADERVPPDPHPRQDRRVRADLRASLDPGTHEGLLRALAEGVLRV